MHHQPSHILPATDANLDLAASLIQAGKLVAFPTETVYGLGADATNEQAVASIYAAKGRPQFNPLIVHVADTKILPTYVEWTEEAQKIADLFWPGPLTLVLPRKKNSPISLLASAGLDTIAVRCPNHPVARDLIRKSERPIAAPSANASGSISPTKAIHVADSLGHNVDMILEGGSSEVGLESTVLSLTHGKPTILRHGGITKKALEKILGPIQQALHDEKAPQSPGMLLSHYAPSIGIRLNATTVKETEALLAFGDDSQIKGGAQRLNLSPSGNLIEAAANLFAMMRSLDRADLSGIAVMPIPSKDIGAAINDRLNRAAIGQKS